MPKNGLALLIRLQATENYKTAKMRKILANINFGYTTPNDFT